MNICEQPSTSGVLVATMPIAELSMTADSTSKYVDMLSIESTNVFRTNDSVEVLAREAEELRKKLDAERMKLNDIPSKSSLFD